MELTKEMIELIHESINHYQCEDCYHKYRKKCYEKKGNTICADISIWLDEQKKKLNSKFTYEEIK